MVGISGRGRLELCRAESDILVFSISDFFANCDACFKLDFPGVAPSPGGGERIVGDVRGPARVSAWNFKLNKDREGERERGREGGCSPGEKSVCHGHVAYSAF